MNGIFKREERLFWFLEKNTNSGKQHSIFFESFYFINALNRFRKMKNDLGKGKLAFYNTLKNKIFCCKKSNTILYPICK